MKKPNFSSVTRKACTCGALERAAEKPDIPVTYDAEVNEYHITYPVMHEGQEGTGLLCIYHCFFCGGAAPESKRDQLFAKVTDKEVTRLDKLTSPIKSVQEAIAAFGEPDCDEPQGTTIVTPAFSSEPPQIQSFRILIFGGLSETADVMLFDYGPGGIKFSFSPKYVGGPKDKD